MFRWLTKKYPKITVSATEEQNIVINGISIPVDATKPNPNGFEVDNLYLDMNGIIHPCTHPEDKPPPESEEEAMVEIFAYIDRIMDIVRPRKLVYMAIDGVAPRAKMNQQRSRRFRASREASLISHPDDDGEQGDSSKWKFDSNCITPGTPFMSRLAECLKFYIADRLSRRAGWANVKVILSDASVPGEGEHKIIDFIRRQRLGARYDPNTRHVLYGLDADLIMLALATHEPHFKILREDIFSKEKGKHQCRLCGGTGHYADECTGNNNMNAQYCICLTMYIFSTGKLPQEKKEPKKIPFVFLNISVLREYLEVEMRVPGARFPFNLERSIDDWVFLCFFVGNDFLPHMPSLEIREGAIDRLITIYKAMLPQVGGYLTDSGSVNLAGVQTIMLELGRQEDEIFRKRKEGLYNLCLLNG